MTEWWWSDLTEEDRLVVAEFVAQEQQRQPREGPEAVEPSGGQSIDDANGFELGLINLRMKWVKIMKGRGTSHG